MRLIDADSVIAVCESYSAIEWNKKVAPVSWADAYESFAEEIDSQPTAYSVEAVVRELEEESKFVLHEMNEPAIYAGIQGAIEIVKRGGRDD